MRFFAFRNNRANFRHDVADFLTEYMEGVSEPEEDLRIAFDYDEQKKVFLKTFRVLRQTLDSAAFSFSNRAREALTRSFSVYHFEAFTIGLQSRLEAIDIDKPAVVERLRQIFQRTKLDSEFIRITTGGGKNSPGPLNERIGFVERRIQEGL